MKRTFRRFAAKISNVTGSPYTFLGALLVVILVGDRTGPLFGYSDTWQLVINTSTTIVTFLMVFLIQNTQNRDSKAMQLKLDELIRATQARDAFVDLEDLSDEELSELDKEFQGIREKQSDSKIMRAAPGYDSARARTAETWGADAKERSMHF
jgi:low affinity Fe/Cu permease